MTPQMPCLELLEIPWVKYAALVSERSSLANNSVFQFPSKEKAAFSPDFAAHQVFSRTQGNGSLPKRRRANSPTIRARGQIFW
jgi:hypothetical protein